MGLPILCLDFDGVLHSYSSGWKGAAIIPDPPVAGAIEFLREAIKHFAVAIYSSRSHQPGGLIAMQDWLRDHGGDWDLVSAVDWPKEKPAALVTLDDRALTFDGTWPRIDDLRNFQPWNKRPIGATGDHPQGKLGDDDQGGLRMAIATDKHNGVVRIEFGKPVAWLGLAKATALALADNLRKHANSLTSH